VNADTDLAGIFPALLNDALTTLRNGGRAADDYYDSFCDEGG
jgi:hypothetical protein